MHVKLLCVGKLRDSPERSLVLDYADRFTKTGASIGFRSLDIIEVPAGGGSEAEGARLLSALPDRSRYLRLDEQGRQMTSVAFSHYLARLRDEGLSTLTFLIGGAEGYAHSVRKTCPETLALGVQTWPHRLVRVLLTEQLYRAASLLSGGNYHKA